MDKESKDLLKKIGSAIDKHEKKVGGYEKLKDILCKELFTSCNIDNEQRLQRMAKHQGVSTGNVVVNAAKETYERTKKQYTEAEQKEIEEKLNLTCGNRKSKTNPFYDLGRSRGGGSRKNTAKIYNPCVRLPLAMKPIIQEAAQRASLGVAAFVRQAIHEKLGIQPGQPKENSTQAERNNTVTVDAVLPIKDLSEV